MNDSNFFDIPINLNSLEDDLRISPNDSNSGFFSTQAEELNALKSLSGNKIQSKAKCQGNEHTDTKEERRYQKREPITKVASLSDCIASQMNLIDAKQKADYSKALAKEKGLNEGRFYNVQTAKFEPVKKLNKKPYSEDTLNEIKAVEAIDERQFYAKSKHTQEHKRPTTPVSYRRNEGATNKLSTTGVDWESNRNSGTRGFIAKGFDRGYDTWAKDRHDGRFNRSCTPVKYDRKPYRYDQRPCNRDKYNWDSRGRSNTPDKVHKSQSNLSYYKDLSFSGTFNNKNNKSKPFNHNRYNKYSKSQDRDYRSNNHKQRYNDQRSKSPNSHIHQQPINTYINKYKSHSKNTFTEKPPQVVEKTKQLFKSFLKTYKQGEMHTNIKKLMSFEKEDLAIFTCLALEKDFDFLSKKRSRDSSAKRPKIEDSIDHTERIQSLSNYNKYQQILSDPSLSYEDKLDRLSRLIPHKKSLFDSLKRNKNRKGRSLETQHELYQEKGYKLILKENQKRKYLEILVEA